MPPATLAERLKRFANAARGDTAGLQNMLQLIQLRWIAVTGQVATILFAHYVLRISLPLAPMALIIAALVGLNILSWLRWTRLGQVSDGQVLVNRGFVDDAQRPAPPPEGPLRVCGLLRISEPHGGFLRPND
ncbi:MAG: hypothetical protein JF591_23295, partial [Lysobacter sp.]|nr:hypothetical protein [Lysobacter sp.]